MSGKIRIAQGGRKFAGVLPGPSGPLGKVGMYNYFYMSRIQGTLPLFAAPLLTSLILALGVGVPTFTRATAATVTDFENVVRPVISGEARFTGARRVQNSFSNTENITTVTWLDSFHTTITPGALAPDNSNSAYDIVFTSTAGGERLSQSIANQARGSWTTSFYIKSPTGGTVNIFIDDGAGGSTSEVTLNLTPNWQRFGFNNANVTTGNATRAALVYRINATSVTNIQVWHPQLEYVSGATNSNPADYVSVGVLAAPWNGAGVDGVQYFPNSNGNTLLNRIVVPGSGTAIPLTSLLGYFDEPARTNLIIQASDYTDAAWTAASVDTTPLANQTAAPDGTVTADLLTEGVAGTATEIQAVTGTADVNFAVSRFIKRGNTDWVALQIFNGANIVRAWFNLATGIKGSTNAGGTGIVVSSTMTASINGFFRCSIVGSVGSAATAISSGSCSAAADLSTVRVNGATRFEWGAQFENNSGNVSSFVPTLAATVVRNADLLSYPSAGNVSVGTADGTIYCEVTVQSTITGNGGRRTAVGFSNLVSNNRFELRVPDDASSFANFAYGSGAGVVAVASPLSLVLGVPTKLCVAYGIGGASLSDRGNITTNATPSDFATQTDIGIGSNALNASSNLGGNIRNVEIWGSRFTNANQQSLTT